MPPEAKQCEKTLEINNITYDLACIIIHQGGTDGGHYYSFVNRPYFEDPTIQHGFEQGWYKADDKIFKKLTPDEYKEFNEGYIYFFVKRENNSEFPHSIMNTNIRYKYIDNYQIPRINTEDSE